LQNINLMPELKYKVIANKTQYNEGYVSEILHYKKGLSKDAIRILAAHFKLSQEAFNRPYPLLEAVKTKPKPPQARKPKKRSAAA